MSNKLLEPNSNVSSMRLGFLIMIGVISIALFWILGILSYQVSKGQPLDILGFAALITSLSTTLGVIAGAKAHQKKAEL